MANHFVKKCARVLPLWLTMSTSYAESQTLTSMLENLALSLGQVWQMLTGACFIFGIMIFLSGMFKLKKYGQMTVFMMSHAELFGPLSRIIIGTLLINTQYALNTVLSTVWNTGQGSTIDQIQSYQVSMSGNDAMMYPVFLIIQVIGLVAFIRGMLKLTKAGEQGAQPGTIPMAIMLVFGGVMCINIVGTINMVRTTLGLGAF